jgi:hypothetical protein
MGMKKAKIAFWSILIAFIALLAYQNWDFFMSTHGLKINLLFIDYRTPELQNIILFLIFFFAGLLISYFFSLLDRFKSNKIIKNLTTSLEQNQQMMEALKSEMNALKADTPLETIPAEAGPVSDSEKEPDVS